VKPNTGEVRSDSVPSADEAEESKDEYRVILNTRDGELIDDRELRDHRQDRFRHGDIADLLSEIAATAETPANIALYGPWGSGKSGVSNLIKNRLANKAFRKVHGKTVYFRFDAFQYSSELPLRRAFLVNLARDRHSKKRAQADKRRLYSSVTSNTFEPSAFWPPVWRYIAVIALILGVVTVVDATFGSIGSSSFLEALGESASRVIAPAVAPAVLIAGLIAFLKDQLTVRRTTVPPATDDEFEALFRELVRDVLKKQSAKRLVVFIDELDRCAPSRVVDVLDTVRTFLDAPNTVFIIAADRQVLEQALSENVSQSTPSDLTNPYYSSGSEYLDKVFHYQMSLSPLLPQRVTTYAIDLVKDQPGIWAELKEHDLLPEIMSVLVPSHVRSPRRVKTLINNYTIAYHVARLREQAGQLDSGPDNRPLELAKLVCLRTEFPAFGRDLALSDRLPEYFRLIADGETRPNHVPTTVWAVAESYFSEEQSVETMLDDRSQAGASVSEIDADNAGGINDDESITTTRRAIKRQLDHYLQKTSRIQDPRRDLIFLEQSGHTYGLSSDLAYQLEQIAVENRVSDAQQVVQKNPEDHEAILRFLSGVASQSFPGVEGDNAVAVLLAVSDTADPLAVEASARQAVSAVMAHRRRLNFSEEDLPGALALGLKADGPDATDLVNTVLRHEAAATNGEVGLMVIRRLGELPDPGAADVARIASGLLYSPAESQAFVSALVEARAEAAATMLAAMQPIAVERLNEMDESADEGDSRRIEVFEEAIALAWSTESADVREGLLCIWLVSDCESIEAGSVLEYVGGKRLETGHGTGSLLEQLPTLVVEELAPWVLLLNPEQVSHDHRAAVSRLVNEVWKRREEFADEDLGTVLAHLPSIMDASGAGRSTFKESDSIDLDTDAKVRVRESFWADALRFQSAGAFKNVGSLVAREVAAAFSSAHGPMQPAQVLEYESMLTSWAREAIGVTIDDATLDLVEAIHDSPWFGESERFRLCVELSVASAGSLSEADHNRLRRMHTTDEIVDEFSSDRDAALPVVAAWIGTFGPSPDELSTLVEPYLLTSTYALASGLRHAVREVSNDLSAVERLKLAEAEIARRSPTSYPFLSDISFDTVDQAAAGQMVIDVFVSASNLQEKREALNLWKTLNPSQSSVRRNLIGSVLIAGLEGQAAKGWLDLLLKNDYLRIWEEPPRGTKEAIRKAMAPLAVEGRRRRVKVALRKNGISTAGFGGFADRFLGS